MSENAKVERPLLTGGCVCGAVRYESAGRPLMMFNCHCRTCQMVSGGPYVGVVLLRRKVFKITQGALKFHYTDRVDGGKHKRGFCPDCGSRVTGADSDEPRPWIAVTASSLDDPSIFKPTHDIFTSHAQAWDRLDPARPHHAQHAPQSVKKQADLTE